jgi:hypothetical protein
VAFSADAGSHVRALLDQHLPGAEDGDLVAVGHGGSMRAAIWSRSVSVDDADRSSPS